MTQFFEYLSAKYEPSSVDEVNRRLLELSSLFEISQHLNASLDLKQILNNLLFIPMGRLLIPKGAIFLREEDTFRIRMVKGFTAKLPEKGFPAGPLPEEPVIFQPEQSPEKLPEILKFGRENRFKIFLPIKSASEIVGGVLFGAKLNGTAFSEEEINFLTSLANISASAIENALHLKQIQDINRQLDQKIQQLSTLFEITQGLSATLKVETIIKYLTNALMGQMLVSRYSVAMWRQDKLEVAETRGVQQNLEPLIREIEAVLPQQIINCEQADVSKTINKLLRQSGMELLIPLRHQNRNFGYLLLGARLSREPFDESDIEFLSTLASQAVISLENARLFLQAIEKQKLEDELNVARTIQNKLLPRSLPKIPGYDFYGLNHSSKQVGGDYYDFIPLRNNRLALAIGDVSGKGVPASLLMANLQAGLRTILQEDMPLPKIVQNLNLLIYQNTDPDKYITFFIGILDTAKNTLEFVNAGHNPPYLFSPTKGITSLRAGGIILGMLPEFTYETGLIRLEKGDVLLCYTDGVNEAINLNEEEFGEERIEALLKTEASRSCKQIAERIINAITTFSNSAEQYDDITVLLAKRTE